MQQGVLWQRGEKHLFKLEYNKKYIMLWDTLLTCKIGYDKLQKILKYHAVV
jgi:hypothetical protein